jgi:hypothetical protein
MTIITSWTDPDDQHAMIVVKQENPAPASDGPKEDKGKEKGKEKGEEREELGPGELWLHTPTLVLDCTKTKEFRVRGS